jgi:GcrA cell cycle regulator
MPAGYFWSAEQDAQLRQHWDAGHSTAEIGRRMGVTKNSIIGRAHRLLLPPRAAICNSALAPVSDRQRDIIRNLWRAEPITAICRLTGLDNRRVKKLAVEMALPEKSRGVVFRPAARAQRGLSQTSATRAAFPSRPSAATRCSSVRVTRPATQPGAAAATALDVSSLSNLPGAVAETPPRRVFSNTQCKFVLDGAARVYRFCDAPCVANDKGRPSSFCADHYALCLVSPKKHAEQRKAARLALLEAGQLKPMPGIDTWRWG